MHVWAGSPASSTLSAAGMFKIDRGARVGRHRMVRAWVMPLCRSRWSSLTRRVLLKMRQKRRVSSAPAEATVTPSGLCARCSTRLVCPESSASFTMEGYRQRMSWLCVKPWDDTSSWSCWDHCSAQTWECVSTALRHWPVAAFQKRIMRSAVPPPLARRERCQGAHASPFTADVWRVRVKVGEEVLRSSQILSRLSLPPEARRLPPWVCAQDHLSPHTSWVCACDAETECVGARMSWCLISPARLPEVQCVLLAQASAPTRAEWPSRLRTRLSAVVSHSSTVARDVPTMSCLPDGHHATDVTSIPDSWGSCRSFVI
mmetsp:Transcript_28132/g.82675  ORF Transcript_28132/g.82675 Transcript_28132/m.82675 type:complete len:316 (+) Transcript_28132:233-1180(+)